MSGIFDIISNGGGGNARVLDSLEKTYLLVVAGQILSVSFLSIQLILPATFIIDHAVLI